jgi:hypothetical protein
MLPITMSVDDCSTLSCDPTGLTCPAAMRVGIDAVGGISTCTCGVPWDDLQTQCPDAGGSAYQTAAKEKCPKLYAFSTDDATGMHRCDYNAASAIRVAVGVEVTAAGNVEEDEVDVCE